MISHAILCGSAPAGFLQKNMLCKYNFLTAKDGHSLSPANVTAFYNGVSEIILEAALNKASDAFCQDDADGDCLLYFCALSQAELDLPSQYETVGFGHLPVVLIGKDEIRKEVIAYYKNFFSQLGVNLLVEYDFCYDFVATFPAGIL